MAFGVYVHIPYCLQRCIYCDFATYQASQILPPNDYIRRVKKEILSKSGEIGPRPLDTLYFGGGTPSLLEPELLIEVCDTLRESGFPLKKDAEVTMEINPATLSAEKIQKLLDYGFNRFSVGAQTFNDDLLKKAHRRHSAQDTRDTLSLLKEMGVNFSLDVLFALPTQTKNDLQRDIEEARKFDPPHVSPYCLTLPEGHAFNQNRPMDETQTEMFWMIEEGFPELARYEISNFAKPGYESRHNMLYWKDEEYWGIGLSSHSYIKKGEWGSRFWNPRNIDEYVDAIDKASPGSWKINELTGKEGELLTRKQSMTDFFHTSLRLSEGIDPLRFSQKFGSTPEETAGARLRKLETRGLLERRSNRWSLSKNGILLSNLVFEELTFL